MGKSEQQFVLPLHTPTTNNQNVCCYPICSPNITKFVRLKCIIILFFGFAVCLSAIFWLPPLSQLRHKSDLNLDELIKAYDVVATFKLRSPVSMLKGNITKIELGIFEEIAVPNSTVEVIYLEALADANTSSVVFAVMPNSNSSYISSASLSLLKSSFLSLVLRQSFLRLTSSSFGDPFAFEVLKFRGGITVIPPQTAFLLQKQTFFTFRLNFSINQIQDNFEELKNQLRSGLHLTSYENIYVSLNNTYGSTVAPPTTVQASVLQAIGNQPPSRERLKQLAQTITGPHARNLGLNHTVFGKVKQVRLSTAIQAGPPSPAPLPHPAHHHQHHRHHHHHQHHRHHHHHQHHRHHHHHQHHHHQHHELHHLGPSPAPVKNHDAKPPSNSRTGFNGKDKGQTRISPVCPPVVAPSLHPPSSPLPDVILTHIHPPTKGTANAEPPHTTPSPSPLPSSSARLPILWQFVIVFLSLVLHIF